MKKVFLAIVMIIACIGATGCQNKNTQNDTTIRTEAKESIVVTFDSDGGSEVSNQTIKKGAKVKKPIDPTKSGYIFIEWELDGETYDFDNEISKSITLKATWSEERADEITDETDDEIANESTTENEEVENFVITFDSNGGSKVSNQSVKKGAKVKKPTDPTKSGYTFAGWELNGKSYNFNTKITQNITLKGAWVKKLGVITATEIGIGATVESDGSQTIGKQLKLSSTDGVTGIEIHSSTTKNGTYTLSNTISQKEYNKNSVTVYAKQGEYLYFKIRTYIKYNSQMYYSEYSNVIEINNTLKQPTITEIGKGSSVEKDGSQTFGKQLNVSSTDGITGIEIHSSTAKNGTYTQLKKVSIEEYNKNFVTVYAKQGEQLYIKVRTYLQRDSKTYYSEFSNVVDVDNSSSTQQ